jgi:hypothetical protein
MTELWLVYTDEAGIVEIAGVRSTFEKAVELMGEANRVSGMQWYTRKLPDADAEWVQ